MNVLNTQVNNTKKGKDLPSFLLQYRYVYCFLSQQVFSTYLEMYVIVIKMGINT